MSNRGRVTRVWLAAAAVPALAAGAAAAAAGLSTPRSGVETGAYAVAPGGAAQSGAAGSAAAASGAQRSASGAAAAGASSVSGAAGGGWQVLSRAVVPNLAKLRDLGPLASSQRLQVGVALADPNAAAEEAASRAVYDAKSPAYHHFYTPAQWQARFAIPKATFDGVASQVTAKGLSVAYGAPTRSYMTLAGTVDQVQRTFGVQLHAFQLASGQKFFANLQAPRVPAGVSAVVGLESLSRQLPERGLPAPKSTNQGGPCVQGTCIGLLSPQNLWSIYGQPSTNRGQGQKVAVIGEGDMSVPLSDLRSWEGRFGLPQVPVKEFAIADDQSDTSGLLEWDLDTQATTGMAPDALELDLYFVQSLGVTTGAFSVWANDPNGPLQANASFGGCESLNLALGEVQAEQPIFAQAAAEGRTLFVSTGDTGGSCTVVTGNGILNTVVPQVEFPASSNWVVAVGGTELFAKSGANPTRVLEKAWEYTGGGSSLVQPAQPWQTQIPEVAGRCAVDDTGFPQAAPVCRGLPDVAAMSGDIFFNQYDITSGGSQNFGAGTSLSSPLWAGMWTRIQAAAPTGGLGFAAPALYARGLDQSTDANDFFDVSVGDNGQFPALPRNPADPSGWDYVSGLGVPNVANLMQDLTGRQTPTNNTAPIGGGGATSTSGGCGGPNGTMTAPEGNQLFPFAAASVTRVVPGYSSAQNAVTVTFTVPQMGSGTHNELDFYYIFSYGSGVYELDAEYDPVVGNAFLLYDITSGVAASASSSNLTGSFDFGSGIATITMGVAEFNSAIGPAIPLAAGKVLDNTEAASGYEYDGYSGIIENGECAFTLM